MTSNRRRLVVQSHTVDKILNILSIPNKSLVQTMDNRSHRYTPGVSSTGYRLKHPAVVARTPNNWYSLQKCSTKLMSAVMRIHGCHCLLLADLFHNNDDDDHHHRLLEEHKHFVGMLGLSVGWLKASLSIVMSAKVIVTNRGCTCRLLQRLLLKL